MGDLTQAEIERAKVIFDVYDTEGLGKLDATLLGTALRCMDLNPSTTQVEKNGGKKKKGEKYFTIEQFFPLYLQFKKDKELGTFEDFIEGLKVYDKHENGTMLGAELAHILITLGERMPEIEVDDAMKLAGTPDEEGYIRYEPLVREFMFGDHAPRKFPDATPGAASAETPEEHASTPAEEAPAAPAAP